MIEKLTHFDNHGRAVMVDVTAKQETSRTAIAKGRIRVSADTMTAIREGSAAKGDVLGVARVAGIMRAAGYAQGDCDRVGVLLRKESLKRDPEVQALEDVICFTFIRWYLPGFAATRSAESLSDIVAKTARKMSAEGRARALAEFPMPAELVPHFEA